MVYSWFCQRNLYKTFSAITVWQYCNPAKRLRSMKVVQAGTAIAIKVPPCKVSHLSHMTVSKKITKLKFGLCLANQTAPTVTTDPYFPLKQVKTIFIKENCFKLQNEALCPLTEQLALLACIQHGKIQLFWIFFFLLQTLIRGPETGPRRVMPQLPALILSMTHRPFTKYSVNSTECLCYLP